MAPLKDKPFAAILNSRQSKTPLGSDAWISRTLEAVEYAVRELEATILSSYDLLTWNLVTWKTAQLSAQLELVVPPLPTGRQQAELCDAFGIHPKLLTLRELSELQVVNRRKYWWETRDRTVIESADILLPVSIRPGGKLERSLSAEETTAEVDRRFAVPHLPATHQSHYDFGPGDLNPELHRWRDEYLIHWTRTCHGPWPGETVATFCRDLVASHDQYCRNACHTLVRILRERRIRGSKEHISQQRAVVGMTELSPIESLTQMHWRSRWVNWSFEPYGIAIRRDVVRGLGAVPVRYVDESTWEELDWGERPLCHRQGVESHWVAEREWRLIGDLNLEHVPQDDMIVIVHRPTDVDNVGVAWDGHVISMTR